MLYKQYKSYLIFNDNYASSKLFFVAGITEIVLK